MWYAQNKYLKYETFCNSHVNKNIPIFKKILDFLHIFLLLFLEITPHIKSLYLKELIFLVIFCNITFTK